jgi:hypothetical protein
LYNIRNKIQEARKCMTAWLHDCMKRSQISSTKFLSLSIVFGWANLKFQMTN